MISGIALFLLILGSVFFVMILPLIALIDIVSHSFNGNDKIIWVLVVLLFPFIGSILYFAIGAKQKVR